MAYTVRPELLSELKCGEEYMVGANVVRHLRDDGSFGFADLYARASAIASFRARQLTCQKDCGSLHTRVAMHTWFRHEAVTAVRAAVTLGVRCLGDGETGPEGETYPSPESLSAPGGMTRERMAAMPIGLKGFDEVYTDGDGRKDPQENGIFTFSYGEYVKSTEGLDYSPFIQRAENLTKFHVEDVEGRPYRQDNIVRREWFCATNPDIAVVHIYVSL